MWTQKKSLPLSQMLRVKRIVDREEKTDEALDTMVRRFKERGYPSNLVKQHRTHVQSNTSLSDRIRKKRSVSQRIPLVTTYTNWSNRIAGIVNKYWPIIQRCHSMITEFQDRPLMSYRRPANLRDKLVKSDVGLKGQKTQTFIGKPRLGSFPCLACVNCQYMQKGEKFTHPLTGITSKINFFLTCNSSYVVYALWCPCKMVYIGETKNDIKTRINQHRYSIRKKRLDLPVPKHFCEMDHREKDLRFMVLDHIPTQRRGGDRGLMLKKRELMWIHKLNSLTPNGLNVDYKIMPGM